LLAADNQEILCVPFSATFVKLNEPLMMLARRTERAALEFACLSWQQFL